MGELVNIPWGQEKETTTTRREHPLGAVGMTPDGRCFRWAFSGEAIGAGQLVMQKGAVANHDMDLATATAGSVGDTSITVTLGATAATLNQYEDGALYTNDGTGEGHLYVIRSNPAADASASLVLTLHEKIREATSTSDTLNGLIENDYKDVEIYDADDIDGPALGVAPTEIADNTYFWLQTSGRAAVLIQGTVVNGDAVEASQTTDGAVCLHDVSANTDQAPLGTCAGIIAVTTDYGYINLQIV